MMHSGEELASVPLEQVTLGGEPVDQAVLDQLRAVFPSCPDLVDLRLVRTGGLDRGARRQSRLSRGVARRRTAEGRPTLSVDGDELVIASPAPRRRSRGRGSHRRQGVVVGRPGPDHRPNRQRRDQRRRRQGLRRRREGCLQSHPAVAWAECGVARRRSWAPSSLPKSCRRPAAATIRRRATAI